MATPKATSKPKTKPRARTRAKTTKKPPATETPGAESVADKTTTAAEAISTKDDARLTASATRLVGQAASVLEKELNAGIAAVRALEGRYADVDALRTRDPDDVIQRFRTDAHEVVDLLMDLVQIGASSAAGLAQRAIRVRAAGESGKPEGSGPPGGIPAIESLSAQPGETVTVTMALENAGDDAVEAVNFRASDLVTSSGLHIAASDVDFVPSNVTIAPNSKAQVQISIHIPKNAEPGVYSGMLVASKLEQVRAVLSVTVESAFDSK